MVGSLGAGNIVLNIKKRKSEQQRKTTSWKGKITLYLKERLLMWEANSSILTPPPFFLKGKVGYQRFSDRFPFWTKQISSWPLFTQVLEVMIRTPLNIQFYTFFSPANLSPLSVTWQQRERDRSVKKKKNQIKLWCWWISELTLKGTLFFLSKVFQSSLQHCLLFSFTPSSSPPMHHFKFL